jgi:hypothetical protein
MISMRQIWLPTRIRQRGRRATTGGSQKLEWASGRALCAAACHPTRTT